MPHFPQLTTGVSGQYPLLKRRRIRVIRNELADGSRVLATDAGADAVQWDLHWTGLTGAEWQNLETFFKQREGRLGNFTFLDPSDNLLAWSEDFSASEWEKGPLLQLAGGVSDPLGGSAAYRITNSGQSSQDLTQAVQGTGTFHYSFSVHARSDQPAGVTLVRSTASSSQSSSHPLTATWGRLLSTGNLGANEEPVSFAMRLDPGATVELFGAQVQAQPALSAYRKTLSRGGVYTKTRFADDRLGVVAEGPDQISAVVRIVTGGRE